MGWEPDRRSNFFFSPPAHLCAVTYMTEISLIVTLNNQFNNNSIPLKWESDKLLKVKQEVDMAYRETLTSKARRMRAVVHKSATEVVDREPSVDFPKWAVKRDSSTQWHSQ